MKCHCTENQHQLALLVGQDAVNPLPEPMRRVVANCPHCRQHYEQLCRSQEALEQALRRESVQLQASLWPALSERLPACRTTLRRNRYERFKQQFIPIFSMTAACLAIALVLSEYGDQNSRTYRTTRAQPSGAVQYTTSESAVDRPWQGRPLLSLTPRSNVENSVRAVGQASRPPLFERSAPSSALSGSRDLLPVESLFDFLDTEFERDQLRAHK